MDKANKLFKRRQTRVRTSIRQKAVGRPRLSVFRSSMHIYAQIIDDVNGATVNVRINAERCDSPNCGSTPGGYQYTAAIRGLNDGDYTVRVIHSVPGSGDKEFTKAVSVR